MLEHLPTFGNFQAFGWVFFGLFIPIIIISLIVTCGQISKSNAYIEERKKAKQQAFNDYMARLERSGTVGQGVASFGTTLEMKSM
mmetsp:Transcript_6519/g.10475  ORF Transcript_6519/g.10475 Transcript_6519/m.10475 type:complete len:85 (+) Transcript_6519:848-1102(+)